MSSPVLIPPGEGEIVGDSPDRRVEILSEHETLNATWSRFGPEREGADLHVHREHTDLFYVLEGELVIRLGSEGEPVRLPAGALARVPPLVVHGFRNGSDADVRYLNLHAPGVRFAEYLRAMRDRRDFAFDQHDPPADGSRSVSEAAIAVEEVLSDEPGLRVALLVEVEEIAIAEVRSVPGGPSPPLHLHRRHVESFYVLEGEMRFTAGERELHAHTGSWVQVPPGTPHSFALVGERPVRYLTIHTPSLGFGDFLRSLHATGSEADRAAARDAFDQFIV